MNRLRRAAITEDGTEVGGILLGRKVSDDQITIEDFESLASEHRRGLTFTLSQADRKKLIKCLEDSHHGLQIVGCFRTHMRQGLYMDQYDQEIMSGHFASPSDVMLLIRPRDWHAGIFVWEDGDIHRQKSYREFTFDAARLPITPLVLPDADPKPRRRVRAATSESGRLPFAFSKASLPTLAKVGLVAATFGLVGVLAFYAHEHRISSPPNPADAASSKLQVPADIQPPSPATVNPPFDPDLGTTADSDEMHVKLSEPDTRPSPFTSKPANPEPAASTKAPLKTFVPPPPMTMPPAPPVETAANIPPSVLDVVRLKPAPPQIVSIVSLEPAEPNVVSRSINHVPVLNLLQRRKYKAGDKFSPASPVRRVNPRLPADLQNVDYKNPIDVKVWIDDNGLVTKALVLNDRNETEVADFAAHTALKWTFTPAKLSDHPVSSEMVMHFRFEPRQAY
ncbi:MAG TPA: hypothetical protein VGL72_30100 [Bryobacteraceae bacterium]